jgi:hypothetical protein
MRYDGTMPWSETILAYLPFFVGGLFALVAVVSLVHAVTLAGMARLLAHGVPTSGRIVGLDATAIRGGEGAHLHKRMAVTAEVHPQGSASYVIRFHQMLSDLQVPLLQPGTLVELRVDRSDPMKAAIAAFTPQATPGRAPGTPQPAEPHRAGVRGPDRRHFSWLRSAASRRTEYAAVCR